MLSPLKNLLGEVGLKIGLASVPALPPALDGDEDYEYIANFPTFRSRITPSKRLNFILSTLRRRGVQVYVSPEAMDAVDSRASSRVGLTAEHTSSAAYFWQSHATQIPGAPSAAVREDKSPLIWLNLAKHGYGAGGTPEEDELVYTLLREVMNAMTILLGHKPLDSSASPRDRVSREISILQGRKDILDRMGLNELLERNKVVLSSCSRHVRDKSQLVAAKTLGAQAADHFFTTPDKFALMRNEDGHAKDIPEQRAIVLMDLLETHNLPRHTTISELRAVTDYAARSCISELEYWDGRVPAEREYENIRSLMPEDGLGH
jgi:hypothetical protein